MPVLTDPDHSPLPWGGLTTLSALLMKSAPLGFLLVFSWFSPASTTCFSFVLFADSHLGAHGGHQASAHKSYFILLFGGQSPSSPSLSQGFLTASPNCALHGVRARMAFGPPPSPPQTINLAQCLEQRCQMLQVGK